MRLIYQTVASVLYPISDGLYWLADRINSVAAEAFWRGLTKEEQDNLETMAKSLYEQTLEEAVSNKVVPYLPS